MADAENTGKRRRSDQEVGLQTRSGVAIKSSTTIGVRTRGGSALRQATIKHGADNVVGKKVGKRMRRKLEVIPMATSSWQEPCQQLQDQPVESMTGAGNEVGNNIGMYTGRWAAAKRQMKGKKLEVISTVTNPWQQTEQDQLDRSNQKPGDQSPAEHQQPNVEHPDNQTNINQQPDEHGVGGIPLQHHNTDDSCRLVLKNKRLRDSLVESTGSNFDEAVADDGRKIATMHGASHGQSDEGPDQLAQPDLQSESQPSNSDGESLSEIAKSRILGPTWSTETSATPGLLVYTAEELKRLVVEALDKQEICHRAVIDVAYQRISERDARHRFLLKTLYDKTGFDLPQYPGISGEVQDAQGKPSNPHQ